MNNPSKESNRLEELEFQHNEVDALVKRRYTEYASNYEINRLKTIKLWYKDKIHRLNKTLKAQHEA